MGRNNQPETLRANAQPKHSRGERWFDGYRCAHHMFAFAHGLNSISLIDHLLGLDPEETIEAKRNLFRFYNYVKHLLPNHEVSLMLSASKTLGQIAEIGGAAFGERFMDYEVQAAIDLIQPDKHESPRHAGVLILKELARNSPTYFHPHISVVFDNILIPLRDPRVHIREGAAELLAACLDIITTRERQTRSPYLSKMLQDAQQGLKSSSMDVVHGSLLTYRELLLHAGMVSGQPLYDTNLVMIIIFFVVHARELSRYRRADPTL